MESTNVDTEVETESCVWLASHCDYLVESAHVHVIDMGGKSRKNIECIKKMSQMQKGLFCFLFCKIWDIFAFLVRLS